MSLVLPHQPAGLVAASARLLLPASGRTLPPLPGNLKASGASPEAAAMVARLSVAATRAAAQARVLAARAAETAEAHRPALEQRARDMAAAAGQQAGRLGARAAVLASEGVARTRDGLQDGSARRRLAGLPRRTLLAGAAGVAVLTGLVALVAGNAASGAAQRRLDAALDAYGLRTAIHTRNISASLFGDVILHGVSVITPDGLLLQAATVDVDHIEMDGSSLRRLSMSVQGLAVPMLRLAREDRAPWAVALAGLGYTAPQLDVSADLRLDDSDEVATLTSSGIVPDLGGWTISLSLGGLSARKFRQAATALRSLAEAQDVSFRRSFTFGMAGDPEAAEHTLQDIAAGLALRDISLTLANGGLVRRLHAIPGDATPETTEPRRHAAAWQALADHVRAATAAADADAALDALANWSRDGGSLVVEAKPTAPLPLFRPGEMGGPPQPVPADADFLGALNLRISR
jgi:hypothetical protein